MDGHPSAERRRTEPRLQADSPSFARLASVLPPHTVRAVASDVHFARTDDGARVAYTQAGNGDVDLLVVGGYGTFLPLDAAGEHPRWAAFERRLQAFSRVIHFDPRGMGMSDRVPGALHLDDWVRDAAAVLQAAGSNRAAVLGAGFDGLTSIRLTRLMPQLVSRLILANAFARLERAPDFPEGVPAHVLDSALEAIDSDGGSDIEAIAPSIASDADTRGWWDRASRRGAGFYAAGAMWDMMRTADVREDAREVSVPTLVLHTAGNRFIRPPQGAWLAREIRGARYVSIPGDDQLIWALPRHDAPAAIEEFLTGRRSATSASRSMVAILFTDIVGSTGLNAAAGDVRWVEVVARHEARTRATVSTFGGRVIKGLGDGILALFPTASSALLAGEAILAMSKEQGVDVRAAVHAGEVDEFDNDVFGLGVTVAARILGLAPGDSLITTRTVVELLAGSPTTFRPHGTHSLKGLPTPWEVLLVERSSP